MCQNIKQCNKKIKYDDLAESLFQFFRLSAHHYLLAFNIRPIPMWRCMAYVYNLFILMFAIENKAFVCFYRRERYITKKGLVRLFGQPPNKRKTSVLLDKNQSVIFTNSYLEPV
ncbi:hypothetical protein D0T57_14590 [Dysgonomonas sp. 511]|nr:hypothetical protein [Dysgonomonas sp. 511]